MYLRHGIRTICHLARLPSLSAMLTNRSPACTCYFPWLNSSCGSKNCCYKPYIITYSSFIALSSNFEPLINLQFRCDHKLTHMHIDSRYWGWNSNPGFLGFWDGSGRYLRMVYLEPYLILLGAFQIFSVCKHLQLSLRMSFVTRIDIFLKLTAEHFDSYSWWLSPTCKLMIVLAPLQDNYQQFDNRPTTRGGREAIKAGRFGFIQECLLWCDSPRHCQPDKLSKLVRISFIRQGSFKGFCHFLTFVKNGDGQRKIW